MTKPISRKLAEAALASVREQFQSYIQSAVGQPALRVGDVVGCGGVVLVPEQVEEYGPKLIEAWDGQHWAICWEEYAPETWTYRCPAGGVDPVLTEALNETVTTPAAPNWPAEVFAEPYDHCVLMLYPNE